MVGYGHSWGDNRVFYREPESEAVRSLPASWTDAEPPDPFIALGRGRSYFKVEDLLILAGLLDRLQAREDL